MNHGILRISVPVFLIGMFLPTPAIGQRRPEPPPWPPPQQPRQAEVTPEFLKAYKRAGSPRLLIFTHQISVNRSDEQALTEAGAAHMFNSRLKQQFVHPDVSVMNLPGGGFGRSDEFHALARSDQWAAARELGKRASADVVILTLLTEQTGRVDDTRYAASYVIVDINRGQNLGNWSWDIRSDEPDGNLSAARLGQYAAALGRRIYRDFEIYHPREAGGTARKYTLQVSGAPDEAAATLRDAVRNIDGVREVVRTYFEGMAEETITLIDVKYAGDPLDLATSARRVAAQALNMDVDFSRSGEGVIVLAARPKLSSAQTYTLRIRGTPDVAATTLRDGIRGIDGVSKILRTGFSGYGTRAETTIGVEYAGDPLDLAMGARAVAARTLDMNVYFTWSGAGEIVLEAVPKPLTSVESLLSGNQVAPEQAAQARELRNRFAQAYKSKASPRLAVMINRQAVAPAGESSTREQTATDTAEEPTETVPLMPTSAPTGAGGGVQVYVSPHIYVDSQVGDTSGGAGTSGNVQDPSGEDATPRDDAAINDDLMNLGDDALLNTRVMEDRILERLGKLKVRLKDLEQAWRLLAKEKRFQEEVWDNLQLSRLLAEKAGADIVIAGVGRVVRKQRSVEVQYTFRAYSVHNAEILAAAPARRELHGGGFNLDGVSNDLAAEVVGKLAYQMMQHWEPPSRIEIWVTNASSVREVQRVADLLEEKVPGVLRATNNGFDSSSAEAIGYLEIEHTGEYEDLIRALDRQQDLPFDLDNVSSNRERLMLKITGQLP